MHTKDPPRLSPSMDKSQLARLMTVISSVTIIADSLDQNSPTIKNVPTPAGPASAHVLAKSPIDQAKLWQQRLYQLLPQRLRAYIEKSFN